MTFEHLKSDGTPQGTTAAPPERRDSVWTDAQGWDVFFPGRRGDKTVAGVTIGPESALSVAAAYACINVIATDVAALPLRLYRKRKSGGRDEVNDHPISDLLRTSPDGETTSMRWRQALMGHMLGWGNGYAEIERDVGGRVLGLHLLDPATTKPERRPQDKKLYYRLANGTTLSPARCLHLAGLGFDGLCGYSPIQMAREALGLAKAGESFAASFYGNGAMPGGVLENPGILKDEARRNMRADFEQIHRGADKAWKLAILQQGTTYKPLTMPLRDAQWLEGRQFQVIEIARLYRTPPHKIGDYSQSHLANIEASNLDYLTTVAAPWCVQWEQICNLRLLTKDERDDGYYVEHTLAALLRGDMKSRAEFYTKLRDLGAISPNEIREYENMNPVENGDVYLVPMNMIALENAGTVPTARVDVPGVTGA